MKTIATSALFASAFATSLGFSSAVAAAEPAHEAPVAAHYGNDDQVLGQGSNLGAEQLVGPGQGGQKATTADVKRAADDADDEDDEDEDDGETPGRPGGNTHLPRNGITHDNSDSDQDDDDAPVAKTGDQVPSRPGGKTHFSRNGMEHDNSDHPVTGQGPNKGTGTLNDTLDTAGGKHHR
ncbi:hypothetical protein [Segniliparus rugosus]|uniref:Uncharacterized protein n=1 Tax=Segniliparus rugosus (strain ATCC BAA-974 / DSM 45345 / CCUG 50838 / CIP 108380 / JCM 13579 / CDC 945) TaxID=679197 RepID=E5XSP3_SEGRC|nr:hypothetical protein [Segniliparus rugosus]EFV12625.1 hypothetical protein HMPREF9336_02515 [Segniliparus rugosus ATCC BAA-974]